MKPEEFKTLYLGEFPVLTPEVIQVQSYEEAIRYARDKGIYPKDVKYLSRVEQVVGIDRDWHKNPNAPLILAVCVIKPEVWNAAHDRGLFKSVAKEINP